MVQTRAMTRANMRLARARRWIKRYRPRDVYHRHRLPDRQPRDQLVHTYRRRS